MRHPFFLVALPPLQQCKALPLVRNLLTMLVSPVSVNYLAMALECIWHTLLLPVKYVYLNLPLSLLLKASAPETGQLSHPQF